MHFRTCGLLLCSMGIAILVTGCGGASDAPQLAAVSGVVLLDGQPLKKGSIQFTPDSSKGTTGRMALGEIKPDGKFVLGTTVPGDGARVGFHKVAVNCFDSTPFNPNNPAQSTTKWLIPEKYGDDRTSGLTAEVKTGNKNTFTFSLTTK